MKNVSLPLFGALSAALLAANLSMATPITGSLDFSGGAQLDGSTLGSATQVLTWTSVNVTPLGVTPGSALDTTINPGDSVSMLGPWAFTSGATGLWSVGGFTFDLATSGIVFQTDDFLSVKGYGSVSGNSFDPTPGMWFFTSQGKGIGEGNFSFSATTRAVPDGGTTSILLGAALIGLAAGAKRKNRQA
jgi:hypothetical protein